MKTWVLILCIGSSNGGDALTSVPGFESFEECKAAGERANKEIGGFGWYEGFSCLLQTRSGR